MTLRIAAVTVALVFLASGPVYGRRTKARRKHVPELIYTVSPSEAIDARVKLEIEK